MGGEFAAPSLKVLIPLSPFSGRRSADGTTECSGLRTVGSCLRGVAVLQGATRPALPQERAMMKPEPSRVQAWQLATRRTFLMNDPPPPPPHGHDLLPYGHDPGTATPGRDAAGRVVPGHPGLWRRQSLVAACEVRRAPEPEDGNTAGSGTESCRPQARAVRPGGHCGCHPRATSTWIRAGGGSLRGLATGGHIISMPVGLCPIQDPERGYSC